LRIHDSSCDFSTAGYRSESSRAPLAFFPGGIACMVCELAQLLWRHRAQAPAGRYNRIDINRIYSIKLDKPLK